LSKNNFPKPINPPKKAIKCEKYYGIEINDPYVFANEKYSLFRKVAYRNIKKGEAQWYLLTKADGSQTKTPHKFFHFFLSHDFISEHFLPELEFITWI